MKDAQPVELPPELQIGCRSPRRLTHTATSPGWSQFSSTGTSLGEIEVWGDGTAVRSYTYVDDLVDGILMLTASDRDEPANIGNPEYVSVNELVATVAAVAGKTVTIRHIDGPVGVQSRNFSNAAIEKLGFRANFPLKAGTERTYPWVAAQVEAARTTH